MATARITVIPPAPPVDVIDKVTLTLSEEEATYVLAALGAGLGHHSVYSALYDALKLGGYTSEQLSELSDEDSEFASELPWLKER